MPLRVCLYMYVRGILPILTAFPIFPLPGSQTKDFGGPYQSFDDSGPADQRIS